MTYDFKKIVLRRIVFPGSTASGLRRWWISDGMSGRLPAAKPLTGRKHGL
jgi:hypothetical protein